MMEYTAGEEKIPGYLAQPAEEGSFPGVVVIQEWWGLVPHIKEVTDRFASAGFIALSPDLYHGEVAEEPDEARKLAMALDRERAIQEVSAAAAYLNAHPNTAPKIAGVVGWCMGGGLSLSSAAHSDEIGAAVVFYGRPLEAADTAKLKAPVLGHYGEADQGIPLSLVRDFEKELKENKVTHDIHVYPDAPHAFFNDTRPQAYRPADAEVAWKRTLEWFRKYLV